MKKETIIGLVVLGIIAGIIIYNRKKSSGEKTKLGASILDPEPVIPAPEQPEIITPDQSEQMPAQDATPQLTDVEAKIVTATDQVGTVLDEMISSEPDEIVEVQNPRSIALNPELNKIYTEAEQNGVIKDMTVKAIEEENTEDVPVRNEIKQTVFEYSTPQKDIIGNTYPDFTGYKGTTDPDIDIEEYVPEEPDSIPTLALKFQRQGAMQ